MPFAVNRLKTGTPPRIDGKTIDYSSLQAQPGDRPTPVFSFFGDAERHPRQVDCHITATNRRTHEIIASALHRSPIYGGMIEGVGPRYCPSIEDKVVRFAERDKPSDFHRTRGAGHQRNLSQRHFHQFAVRCAVSFCAKHRGLRAGGESRAPDTPSNTISSTRAA